jgi:phosphopantetheinyl transferase
MSIIRIIKVDLDAEKARAVAAGRLYGSLSVAEQQRAASFANATEKARFLVSHIALRHLVLSRCSHTFPPRDFARTENGKPYLPGGPAFSFSHSGGLAIVAISDQDTVGVDIEQIRRVAIPAEWYTHFPALAGMLQTPPEAKSGACQTFLTAWTRLEALAKCEDIPMSLLLDLPIRVAASAATVCDLNVENGYLVALAFRGNAQVVVAEAEWDVCYGPRVREPDHKEFREPSP